MCDQCGNTVRIGPYDYHIKSVSDLRTKNGKKMYGVIDYQNCTILVNKDSDRQVQDVTLWHEFIHALLYNAGITKHKEKQIEIISFGIVQILRDNPQLLTSFYAVRSEEDYPVGAVEDEFVKKHPDIAVIK